ncbi:nitrogen regulatory protein P-II family [Lacrimispora xylanisolvens]|uniref:Nitrogen regulatory protein P-II family n=1 Tax=Lacrimispora xylanisolvens TaxID=384636 RepID=A0A2S6HWU4_9FIRM|nr:P-II family nitrogen regulator [Hungatella xylanolytica]PPK82383.1 nitrogen regulatory protein P-II family [Hungatella xylanolytica]
MKEVMAFIRVNKINPTKKALAEGGFPAFTCRPVLGRGKKRIDPELLSLVLETGELPMSPKGEYLTESFRWIPKRLITLIVEDPQVKGVVDILIKTNQTGNPGDGKIFVLPIYEAYTVRSGESTIEAY